MYVSYANKADHEGDDGCNRKTTTADTLQLSDKSGPFLGRDA